jgi:hypothetical protein
MGAALAVVGGLALGGTVAGGVAAAPWIAKQLRKAPAVRSSGRDTARDAQFGFRAPETYEGALKENADASFSLEGFAEGAASGAAFGAGLGGPLAPLFALVGGIVGGVLGAVEEFLSQRQGEDIIREQITKFAKSNGYATDTKTIDYLTHLTQVINYPGRLAFRTGGTPRGHLGLVYPFSAQERDPDPSLAAKWAATHFLFDETVRQGSSAVSRSRGWRKDSRGVVVPSPAPGVLPIRIMNADRRIKLYDGTPIMRRTYLEAIPVSGPRQDWTLARPMDRGDLVVMHAEHAAKVMKLELVA